jgi:hypothetical protein
MDLGGERGIDRSLEDVDSNEAERAVMAAPIEPHIPASHETDVGVEGAARVGTGAHALDIGDADNPVEISDGRRVTGAREKDMKCFGARAEWLDTARDRSRLGRPVAVLVSRGRRRPGAQSCAGDYAACDDRAPLNHPSARHNMLMGVSRPNLRGCGW